MHLGSSLFFEQPTSNMRQSVLLLPLPMFELMRLATVWTHSAHSQALRARITPFGYTRGAGGGAVSSTTQGSSGVQPLAVMEPKRAAILFAVDRQASSCAVDFRGRPWLVNRFARMGFGYQGGLDANGQLTAVHSAFYSPHMLDARPLGALLAGMPAGETKPGGFLATEWPYRPDQEWSWNRSMRCPSSGGDSPIRPPAV